RITLFADLAPKLGWLFADPEPDEAARANLAKDPDHEQWLALWADELERSELPPSWPADRAGADAAVRLPSRKDAPEPQAPFATPSRIEADCRAFVDRLGVKFGRFVHPVRAALTGTDRGPGLFDVVFLLGKEACVRRLRATASR